MPQFTRSLRSDLKKHEYLVKNLEFPFHAKYQPEYGRPVQTKVIGLGDPDEEPMIDDLYGLFCEARIKGHIVERPLGEIEDAKPNRQLIADYSYWFGNWR